MPSKAAATPRAPQPAMAAGNEARYIENLNAPGTENYNAQYGGGGWVNYKAGTPQNELASDDFLRAYSKATTMSNRTGRMGGLGSTENVNRLAAQFDAEQAAQGQAATTSPGTNTKSYKDLKSIAGGLRIQGDNILGRREAGRIARGTGRSYDEVIEKALGSGMSIGGGAVKRSNRAFEQSGAGMLSQATGGLSGRNAPLAQMRRATPGKGQMYSGTYELDGQTMPLIESRRGGAASTLAGGGGRRRGGKGKGKRGRGGASDMGGMGTEATPTVAPMEPMTPEQMQEASRIEINMPGIGEDLSNWATGFRSKRSSRKRAGTMAQGLASQRVNPTGSWSYKI